MRSWTSCHGSSTLIVTLAALPESGRPSVWRDDGARHDQFADSYPPGRLWNVPLTCTSTFGIV